MHFILWNVTGTSALSMLRYSVFIFHFPDNIPLDTINSIMLVLENTWSNSTGLSEKSLNEEKEM